MNHRQGRFGYANALLQQCARVAMKLGDDKRAARLFGAAAVDRGPLIMQLIQPYESAACAAARETLRERLGAAGLEALAAEGRRWTLAQAVAQAAPRAGQLS